MKREPLLVIGAGDVGAYLAWNVERFGLPYEVIGFLDDDPAKAGRSLCGIPVLGPVAAVARDPGIAVIVGIAAPAARRRIVEEVALHTDNFPALVAPTAWISAGVTVGKGVIVYPNVSVNYGADIGDFCIVNMNCAVGHDCVLSEFSTLAPGVKLAGYTHLEREAEIGIGAATRQGVRIGAGAVVGGQAMVISDVPPGRTALGVPARLVLSRRGVEAPGGREGSGVRG